VRDVDCIMLIVEMQDAILRDMENRRGDMRDLLHSSSINILRTRKVDFVGCGNI
jgi:hypothetical protein